ncbi:histidine phosphatase family protein [Thiobacillus sp.]
MRVRKGRNRWPISIRGWWRRWKRPGLDIPEQHVLLVGHAGVIRMAFAWALHVPLEQAYRIEVANAGLTRLRFDGGRASLVFHGGCLAHQ